jgi:predicted GH43/DUF377 family glycosyl hydrolase
VYRPAVGVFDLKDQRMLISRSDQPFLAPERDWEKTGRAPSGIFVEAMARSGNRYLFFYGGADKYVCVAEAAFAP